MNVVVVGLTGTSGPHKEIAVGSRAKGCGRSRGAVGAFAWRLIVLILLIVPLSSAMAEPPSTDEVRVGIQRAAEAFQALSYKGGYPYVLSGDLKTRYNAGHGTLKPFPDETYLTMEPPGTPWVGRAYLRAYRATGDERYLTMAKEVGDALATVQLACGGWRMRQPLSDAWADKRVDAEGSYRVTPQADFDDGRTQGPALFLIELVRDGSTEARHQAAMQKALDLLLEAQYPSGGWPQYYPLEGEGFSDLGNYRRYNHINDGSIPEIIRVLLEAYRAFGEQRYLDAVIKAADWLLEVRVPGAVWSQQYYDDYVMGPLKPNHPAPGRWFEPMSITASETRTVVDILTEVWLETGDGRYIAPVDEIVEWYERSRLPDGRWARMYEIHTNRPLYCTPDKVITYSDENLRPGYAWKGKWGDSVLGQIKALKATTREEMLAERAGVPDDSQVEELGKAARKALDGLDDRGLWVVSKGPEAQNVRTGEFYNRMRDLCVYLDAVQTRGGG